MHFGVEDRSEKLLFLLNIPEKALAGSMADRLSLHTVDITDREQVCGLPEAVKERFGKIDMLFNNAGIIQPFIPFAELDYAAIQRVMNINVFGMMFMIRAFLPYLSESPGAWIANTSSMGGFLPVPGQSLYGASKAAVKLLTEGLKAELADSNIGVSVIFPGGVSTNITENSGVRSISESSEKSSGKKPSMKLTTPEHAENIIIKGVEKERPRILVGKDARAMDFLSRMAPVRAGYFMAKMMSSVVEDRFGDPEKLKNKGCPDWPVEVE